MWCNINLVHPHIYVYIIILAFFFAHIFCKSKQVGLVDHVD